MISALTYDNGYDDSNSPCDMIVSLAPAIIATYHDDRVFLWNPTCSPSMMFQFKRVSI